jgi:hypothetical protein
MKKFSGLFRGKIAANRFWIFEEKKSVVLLKKKK